MVWLQSTLTLKPTPRGCHLITHEIQKHLSTLLSNHPTQPKLGLIHLQLLHTSAALTLNENTDPDVRSDMTTTLDRLIPESSTLYKHIDEGLDDMPAHIKCSLMGVSLSIPVSDGRLCLGTWQGVWLCEFRDGGGRRKIMFTFNGE